MTTAEDSDFPDEQDHRSREERTADRQDVVARVTTRGLHIAEDIIYAFTALLLAGGALVVLTEAVYRFSTEVPDGVSGAVEAALESLLIVFILVELLSAVRSAITEHKLVAEPFLLVGILAVIKELVVIATFRIDEGKVADTMLKVGVLGGVVIGLAVATLILRRREREPEESPASPE
jgi:uncharacterized membrane protein (DUF373 family)